jgi:hypothetical protein
MPTTTARLALQLARAHLRSAAAGAQLRTLTSLQSWNPPVLSHARRQHRSAASSVVDGLAGSAAQVASLAEVEQRLGSLSRDPTVSVKNDRDM